MNIQEYIQSGVVELYVAGALCEEDARELESLAQQHPELKHEIQQVEQALEAYALSNQVEPDASLKNKVLTGIRQPESTTPPVFSQPESARQEPEETLRPLPSSRTNWLAIAASLILLLVSAGIGFNFYRKSQQLESEMAALQNDSRQQQELIRGILNDPNYQSAVLKGSDKLPAKMPDAEVRVFWNPQTQQVHLSIGKLPELTENQQYQLWALKDGQPIDAGILELNAAGLVQSLKSIAKVDKWAITIEPKGGSTQPHLDKLCLLSQDNG